MSKSKTGTPSGARMQQLELELNKKLAHQKYDRDMLLKVLDNQAQGKEEHQKKMQLQLQKYEKKVEKVEAKQKQKEKE